jgi:glycosyltransferase involved in cell wall biosynthesis
MTTPPRVLLACSGLEHARRGYESFARECFDALVDEPGIRLELAKGTGAPGRREHVAATLRRDRAPARLAGRALSVRPFRIEAVAFALGLQPLLARLDPELVYLSEWDTAVALARLRALSRQRFKLLLCNGGFAGSGFGHLDCVQQLTPSALEYVLAHGADTSAHTVLPLGFRVSPELEMPSAGERQALRDVLGLPGDRSIVLSVAALNSTHKRLDYLIAELSTLPAPRPYLLLAGEPDAETPAIRALALARLGEAGFEMRTVPAEQVADLYRASDVLAHTALDEAQGRVLIEATAHGLPCVAHEGPVMRFALGASGLLGDLAVAGSLSRLLAEQLASSRETVRDRACEGHAHVYERFSWDRLRPRYVEMLAAVARPNNTVSASTAEKLPR